MSKTINTQNLSHALRMIKTLINLQLSLSPLYQLAHPALRLAIINYNITYVYELVAARFNIDEKMLGAEN